MLSGKVVVVVGVWPSGRRNVVGAAAMGPSSGCEEEGTLADWAFGPSPERLDAQDGEGLVEVAVAMGGGADDDDDDDPDAPLALKAASRSLLPRRAGR